MFGINMFSSKSQQEIEKDIAAIDLRISELEPYQFQERGNLRERKKQLLTQLELYKGKQKMSYEASVSYSPAELYKNYPEGHQARQSFRVSREAKLKLEIKEKQAQLRKLCKEIEELERSKDNTD